MKKPLGCLSTGGIIAGLLTLLLVAGVVLVWGGRLFSPGPLNAQVGGSLGGVQSHAATGGDCAACHTAPWTSTTMSDRCLACHTDVTGQLADAASLHGALKVGADHLPCYSCHPEHKGAAALLTVVDSATFPHDATGYSLKGHRQTSGGAAFTCADCHGSSLANFDVGTCTTCHTGLDAGFMQDHLTAFAAGCLACHDGLDTYGPTFDHNRVAFALAGGHAPLACASCHTGAGTIAELQATPQDCFSCHQKDDAHGGQFGQDCGACHTPADWKQATFDHAKTAFPLVGAHVQVACAQCHVNNVFKGTPTQCVACHAKDDAHNGQFGQDCGACHTADSWQQATFDHSKTAFPLTGAHVQVACAQCHVNNTFQGTPTQCSACHDDPAYHAGLFGTDCASCHTTAAWSPAQFNQSHPFPIDHGTRAAANTCQTCHPDTLQTYTCYGGCHVHQEAEIVARHAREGINNVDNCARCHAGGRGEGGD